MFEDCDLFVSNEEEKKWLSEVISDIIYGFNNDKKSLEIIAIYKLVLWFSYSTVLSYMLVNKSFGKLQDRLFFCRDGQGKLKKIKNSSDVSDIDVFEFSHISESAWCDLLDEIGVDSKVIDSMKGFIQKRHAIAHATGTTSDIIRDTFIEMGEKLVGQLGTVRQGFIGNGDIEVEISSLNDIQGAIEIYCKSYRISRIDSNLMRIKFLEKVPVDLQSDAVQIVNSYFYTE